MKTNIGKNIKTLREERRITQKQLADTLNVNNSRVSNWENEINNPPADMIGDICNALNVSASELLGLKLASEEFTQEERQIIEAYRNKKNMSHAVKVLLGIDTP